jgi:alpha-mannosidase II
LLQKIVDKKTDQKIDSKINFLKYGTTNKREKSGAYLFLPDGAPVDVDIANIFQWIRVESDGKQRNRVCVNMTIVLHCVEIEPINAIARDLKIPAISVWNSVDLRQSHNYELVMNVETSINNKGIFYTDLNGFQHVKRQTLPNLPIQANVYPMPQSSYIEDDKLRFNLLSSGPLGVSSLETSTLQVFLDRRLDQDDNRGMEQAMNDNVLTMNRFILLFENLDNKESAASSMFPSLLSQWLAYDLINPIIKMIANQKINEKDINLLTNPLPCDIRLVNLRTMQTSSETPQKNSVGVILHRLINKNDCSDHESASAGNFIRKQCNKNKKFSFKNFFQFKQYSSIDIKNTHLSFTLKAKDDDIVIREAEPIVNYVQPMQIEAFQVSFRK